MKSALSRAYLRVSRLLQPVHVEISVPSFFDDRSALRLSTAGGRDYIALQLAQHGWSGFEAPVPALISACAQICEGAFFDVGANTGVYSLLVAKAAGKIKIHAFEPYEPATKILRRNIALNKFTGRITVNISALAERPGDQSLYVPLQDHGVLESSASLNPNFKPAHSRTLSIPVTTIDRYVGELNTTMGLLKIDVESAEHRVLIGGKQTIARDRPIIVLEVLHLANHAWLNQFCESYNYQIFTLHPDSIERRDRVAFDGAAWNQCFCPAEKRQMLLDIAPAAGLICK